MLFLVPLSIDITNIGQSTLSLSLSIYLSHSQTLSLRNEKNVLTYIFIHTIYEHIRYQFYEQNSYNHLVKHLKPM